jgi:hypothetical protein
MGPAEIAAYYEDNGLKMPPRSVCNACFANSPEMYRGMRRDRPQDFAQAVAVDAAVRDMTSCGVEEDVFVSKTLKPIGEIAADQYEGEQMELFFWLLFHIVRAATDLVVSRACSPLPNSDWSPQRSNSTRMNW